MAVSATLQPKVVDFIKNPLAYELAGTYLIGTGAKSYAEIRKTGTLAIDDSIILYFIDKVIVFTVVTEADYSGTQLTAGASAAVTAAEFTRNYYVDKYYEVSEVEIGGGVKGIRFEAREKGWIYSILLDLTNFTAYVLNAAQYGSDVQYRENYKMVGIPMLWDPEEGDYHALPEMTFDPDGQGHAVIPVSDILRYLFLDELPEFNTSYIRLCHYAAMKYYFRFAERYGEDPLVYGLKNTDVRYAINGRLPFDKFPGHDFFGGLGTTKKFLSNRPVTRITWHDSQQFLYFMYHSANPKDVHLIGKIYRTSETDTVYILRTHLSASQYQVLCFPCGYDQMTLSAFGGEIYKYDIWLSVDDDTEGLIQISETITFELQQPPVHHRTFLYRNDFGVWETLQAQKLETSYKTEKRLLEKPLPHDYELTDAEITSEMTGAHATFRIRTGYMSAAEAKSLRELLANDRFCLVAATRYIPCILEPGTFRLTDEAEDLCAVEFEYRYHIDGHLSTSEAP